MDLSLSDDKKLLFQSSPIILFALFPVFAWYINPLIILALLAVVATQLPFLGHMARKRALLLGLLLQYPIIHLFLLFGGESDAQQADIAGVASVEFWTTLILSIILIFSFAFGFRDFPRAYKKFVPGALIVSFIVMLLVYFSFEGCRQTSFGFLPFFPAITFLTLSLPLLGFNEKGRGYTPFVLLAMSVIVTAAFTESRGIFVAQLGVFGLIAGFFLIRKDWFRMWAIVLSVLVGTITALVFDSVKACGFSSRIAIVSHSVEEIQQVEPGSAGLRLRMWNNAVDLIRDKPLTGHGVGQDVQAALNGHLHVHNMYLSWLVWGGIVSLLSGVLFVLSPVIAFAKAIKKDENVLLILSGSAVWLFSMVFDSFLSGGIFGEIFVFSTIFSARLAAGLSEDAHDDVT